MKPESPTSPEQAARAWMRAAQHALSQGNLDELRKVVETTPTPADIDATLAALTPQAWAEVTRGEGVPRKPMNTRLVVGGVIAGILLLCLIMQSFTFALCVTQPNRCHQFVVGTYTPTINLTPSPTGTFTPVPTDTPAPSDTPTPVPTPPESGYYVADMAALYPPLPLGAEAAWLLNEADAAVAPPLDDAAVWQVAASADAAAGQENFYYTVTGSAAITWTLDAPFHAGLYQLFVLDTAQNSSGPQDFTILLDVAPAAPYRGQAGVIFNAAHPTDDWLPLGAYEVAEGQTLSVQAAIGPRSAETPFALDRLLIVKVSDAQRQLLDALPQGRVLVSVLDDDRTTFSAVTFDGQVDSLTDDYQGQTQTDSPAWNGSFRSENNRIWVAAGNTLQVDWAAAGRLSAGTYELRVWIPATHATATANYALLADGQLVPRDTPAQILQAESPGQWRTLGQWQLSSEAAVSVRLMVTREGAGDAGEIGVDAVALVRVDQ